MSKTAGKVIGLVGLVAIGIATAGLGLGIAAGAGLGGSLAGSITGLGFLSGVSIGTLFAVGGLGLSLAGSISASNIGNTGSNTRNTPYADPEAVGIFAFGTTTVPLAIVYEEQHGVSPDRQVTDVFAHCWHRIESYQAMYIGGDDGAELVTLSGDAGSGAFANIMWWFRADGTQSSYLTGTPLSNSSWPSSAVFEGVTHSAIVWNIDDDAFVDKYSGVPTKIDIVVQGAWLYDPRLDASYGSGSQDFDDPTTWAFNDGNAALVLLRYIIGEYSSGGDLIWGRGAAETDIDMESFVAMANVADETLDGLPRYQIGGIYPLDGSFDGFVRMWEQETGGKLSKSAGVYRVWLPNDDLTPLTTITDADLLDGAAIESSVIGGIESLFNTGRGRYIKPGDGYKAAPFAEVSEATAISDDGGKRILTQDFAWIQAESIAQRIVRQRIRRSRFNRIWVVPIGWKGKSPMFRPFTVHTLNSRETGYNNQTVRVIDRRSAFSGPTVLVLQQEDSSIYDDTLPLIDPLASNTVPLRIDRFSTITPRYRDGTVIAADGANTLSDAGPIDGTLVDPATNGAFEILTINIPAGDALVTDKFVVIVTGRVGIIAAASGWTVGIGVTKIASGTTFSWTQRIEKTDSLYDQFSVSGQFTGNATERDFGLGVFIDRGTASGDITARFRDLNLQVLQFKR